MIEAGEMGLIEQFITGPSIRTLNERILGGLSRGHIMPIDFDDPTSLAHRIRGQLISIVADYHASHGDYIGSLVCE